MKDIDIKIKDIEVNIENIKHTLMLIMFELGWENSQIKTLLNINEDELVLTRLLINN